MPDLFLLIMHCLMLVAMVPLVLLIGCYVCLIIKAVFYKGDD
jgi:hypothetical protein